MIEPKTYYEVHCDCCGERLYDPDDGTAWETAEEAADAARYFKWQEMTNGKWYCDDCLNGDLTFGEEEP